MGRSGAATQVSPALDPSGGCTLYAGLQICRTMRIILLMSTMLPLADVRERLSPIVSSVEKTHERVVITKNGRPAAVLISYDDLEALEETLEILADPEAVRSIRESLASTERFSIDDIRRDLEARRAAGGAA